MQLTQRIRSNSYVKGASDDIIFTLYISYTINLINSQRQSQKTYYTLYIRMDGVDDTHPHVVTANILQYISLIFDCM